MKKILSILLAVMLLASMAVTASAAEETVTVSFSASGNTGFMDYNAVINYDATALTLVSIDAGALSNGVFYGNTANGEVGFMNTATIEGDGVLFTATFNVNADAAPGSYSISATATNIGGGSFSIVGGTTVTVECNHDWVAGETVAPTCTEAGYTEYTCSICGATKTEEVAALGHTYELTASVDATCTEVGSATYTCSVCGDVYTEEVAAKGHTFVDGVCTVCGAEDPDYVEPTTPVAPAPVDPDLDDEPKTGDITPMITMTVAGVVAMAAAAFFFVFKRKAAK